MADLNSLTEDVGEVFGADGPAAADLEGLAAFLSELAIGIQRQADSAAGASLGELNFSLDAIAACVRMAADTAADAYNSA